MIKLKKKSIISYKGIVYDLSVKTDDKSYNIDSIVVHNSAGGSLILFILDITKIDPIKNNLIFERFLNPNRCFPFKYKLKNIDNDLIEIKDINIGDKILSKNNNFTEVINKSIEIHKNYVKIYLENNEILECSLYHKWPILRNNKKIEVFAKDLIENDELISL